MTTSGRARKPAGQRPAEADTTTQGAVSSPDSADEIPGKGPLAGGLPAAPDDPQQLEQEIEQTREQLGQTVEQLAAKADVKSRAQTKAAEVSRRMRIKASQARQQVVAQAGKVRGQLAGKTAAARHQATSASGAGQSRVAAVATPVWEATPEPLRRAAAKGARERRVPLAVAAGVLVAGYLVIRWWRKR